MPQPSRLTAAPVDVHYDLAYRLDGGNHLFRARLCAATPDAAIVRLAAHVGAQRLKVSRVVRTRDAAIARRVTART